MKRGDNLIKVKKLNQLFTLGKRGNKTEFSVLKDVNFSVDKGEIVTIQGKSGSGKSTLLNLISGFMKPSSGEIWVQGIKVSELNEGDFADFRLANIGFIFQNFQLIPSMTAYQNIELPLILKGVEEKDRAEKIEKTLTKIGLEDFADHYPSELSGGQQQRVSVARALVLEPPLILADEPTGSLDSETEADLLTLIQGLNKDLGITFLIITHDASVAKIGHRTIYIHDGVLTEGEVVS